MSVLLVKITGVKPQPVTKTALTIQVGTVFTGKTMPSGPIKTFMRIYDRIFDVNHPMSTWDNLSRLEILDYKPVEKAEMIIERAEHEEN